MCYTLLLFVFFQYTASLQSIGIIDSVIVNVLILVQPLKISSRICAGAYKWQCHKRTQKYFYRCTNAFLMLNSPKICNECISSYSMYYALLLFVLFQYIASLQRVGIDSIIVSVCLNICPTTKA